MEFEMYTVYTCIVYNNIISIQICSQELDNKHTHTSADSSQILFIY